MAPPTECVGIITNPPTPSSMLRVTGVCVLCAQAPEGVWGAEEVGLIVSDSPLCQPCDRIYVFCDRINWPLETGP